MKCTGLSSALTILFLCNLHNYSQLALAFGLSSSLPFQCSSSIASSSHLSITEHLSIHSLHHNYHHRRRHHANNNNLILQASAADTSQEQSTDAVVEQTTNINEANDNNDQQQHEADEQQQRLLSQNTKYIHTLLTNLSQTLDKYVITESLSTRRRAYNILQQVKRLAMDETLYDEAEGMVRESGMSLEEPPSVDEVPHVPATEQVNGSENNNSNSVDSVGFGNEDGENNDRRFRHLYSSDEYIKIHDDKNNKEDEASSSCGGYVPIKTGQRYAPTTLADEQSGDNRINLAEERLKWEKEQEERHSLEKHYNSVSGIQQSINGSSGTVNGKSSDANNNVNGKSRSALSARMQNAKGGDPFVSSVLESGGSRDVDELVEFANDKKELQSAMSSSDHDDDNANGNESVTNTNNSYASIKASELIARAGAGNAFEGETLGVGGLDDVLSEIQRRVWIPLAAPPNLLHELGIQPVRGLLLYGSPGCGKTLLARKLGSILSPARPITIVSGPEILDKFVGSSEKNLREVFDNPPDLYFNYKKNYGEELANTALHVIVLDEFDAIARARGGAGGSGDQGDAGVARDSVVNQLLAKMDGVSDLGVPTLLIGLTNKPSLIDPALMRPGRFEVQINVPKPKTVAQRVAILKVHMSSMIKSGRVLVRDCPEGTPAWKRLQTVGDEGIPSFDELLDLIAVETDGMSGASLAGVSRAAASRALERAVTNFAGQVTQDSLGVNGDVDKADDQNSIADCLVTFEDFEMAVEDVFESAKGSEYVEPPTVKANDFNTGEFQGLKDLLPETKITKWRK